MQTRKIHERAAYAALFPPDDTSSGTGPINIDKLAFGDYSVFRLTPQTKSKQINASKPKENKKKSKLSRKEKAELGLVKINREKSINLKYKKFSSLRCLWNEYVVDLSKKPEFSKRFLKMDLHGAELHVFRSKCPNFVGVCGTCIFDTKNTFQILTKDNQLKVIPKAVCSFRILNGPADKMPIEFFGKQFMTRPHERSAKKVKKFAQLDL